MKVLRVLSILLLSAMLILVMLFAVGDYTIRSTILSADFVKDRLSAEEYGDSNDKNVYQIAGEEIEEGVLDAFEQQAEEAEGGGWMDSTEPFIDAIEQVFEDTDISLWLQIQLEDILEKVDEDTGEKNGVYPYIKSEADDLEMVVTLRNLKDDFKESFREGVHEVLEEELERLDQGQDVDIQELLDLAASQGVTVEEYLDDAIDEAFAELDEEVPDEWDISPDQDVMDDLDPMRESITAANDWLNILFAVFIVLAVLLALLIALMILLPFNKLMGRVSRVALVLGGVLLVTGILCMAIALVGGSMIPQAIPVDDLTDELTEGLDDLGDDASSESLTDAIEDVVNDDTVESFFSHLFAPVRAAGVVFLVIGAIVFVAGLVLFVVKKLGKEESPPKELLKGIEGAPEGPTEEAFGDWTEQDEKILAESLDEAPETEVSSEGEPAELTEEGAGEPSAEPSDGSDEESLAKLVDESSEASNEGASEESAES